MALKEKRIKINDDRILIFTIIDIPFGSQVTISECFFENDNLFKEYKLVECEDFNFGSWSSDDNTNFNTMSYRFDINHPLFMPLFHLLNYDKELMIDDDDTRELLKKYMIIYYKDDYIYVDFNNYLGSEDDIFAEKFNVFIKNIVFDGRSKIDHQNLNTKDRLLYFFREAFDIWMYGEKQISIEEYLLNINMEYYWELMKGMFKKDFDAPYQRTREIADNLD